MFHNSASYFGSFFCIFYCEYSLSINVLMNFETCGLIILRKLRFISVMTYVVLACWMHRDQRSLLPRSHRSLHKAAVHRDQVSGTVFLDLRLDWKSARDGCQTDTNANDATWERKIDAVHVARGRNYGFMSRAYLFFFFLVPSCVRFSLSAHLHKTCWCGWRQNMLNDYSRELTLSRYHNSQT